MDNNINTDSKSGKRILIYISIFLLFCLVIWHVPPFSEYTNPHNLKEIFLKLSTMPHINIIVLLSFIIAGLTMFPITVLTTAITLFLGFKKGIILSISGCILSATITFYFIRMIGNKAKEFLLTKEKIKRLNKLISNDGITSVMILRMVPIGYTLISVTAALSDVKFSKYIIGTILGVLPDLLLCIFIAGSIHNIILSGEKKYIIFIVIISICFIIIWSILIKGFVKKFKDIQEN